MNKVRGSEVFPPTVIETRSTKYKSAALSQISEIYLNEKKYSPNYKTYIFGSLHLFYLKK